jgi:RNA polymerase sigma-70 factor, ECF subfamily
LFLKLQSYHQKKGGQILSDSDEKLIAEFQQSKNKGVIGILFDRYIHLVFASCMKYFKNQEMAQDAAMEIFESLPDKILKHEIKSFKSWIYTVTRNHCLMQLRKKIPTWVTENLENIYELSVENESFLHLDKKDGESNEYIANCLNELKPDQKVCIELMYIQGKSYKEIAVETGFDLKRVKSLIQNGKRNLRLMLEEYYEKQNRT